MLEESFREAWPRVVRVLAAWSGSLDDAEEYAAWAMSSALDHERTHPDRPVHDLAAWCVSVAKRRWIDDHRRRQVLSRRAPELVLPETTEATMDPDGLPAGLDDRLALLFVACDETLAPAAQMVLALRVVCGLSAAETALHLGVGEAAAAARLTRAKKALAIARGEFQVPDADERRRRLPVVLDCVAGMFSVAHRTDLEPADALTDLGGQARSLADALVEVFPDEPEVRGLRAVVLLGLARRPGRVDPGGVALTLAETDRTRWDRGLLRAGLEDATLAARGSGRFALEAAISGLHSVAPSVEATDWRRIVELYAALEEVWPSPAVRVAALAARTHTGEPWGPVESELETIESNGPSYARRDAGFALADLHWRTGRRAQAAERYRRLAAETTSDAVRRFCERRAGVSRD